MNHIMEYIQIPGYILILWWHGQSQLKLDMSMPDHKNIRIHLWMVAWRGLLTCRRRFFFGENDVPVIFWTCNSPVEVYLRAAGAFFSAKMTFLVFFGHVIALLRSSYVPQALFFRRKWRSWDFWTCNSPVEVFLRAAGAFFSAKMTFLSFLDM